MRAHVFKQIKKKTISEFESIRRWHLPSNPNPISKKTNHSDTKRPKSISIHKQFETVVTPRKVQFGV